MNNRRRIENAKESSSQAARDLRELRAAGGPQVDWDAAIKRLYVILGMSPSRRSVARVKKTPGQGY